MKFPGPGEVEGGEEDRNDLAESSGGGKRGKEVKKVKEGKIELR